MYRLHDNEIENFCVSNVHHHAGRTKYIETDKLEDRQENKTLAVWLSGNALASINVVALRQTRLVLGWVTVCGRVNHFGM